MQNIVDDKESCHSCKKAGIELIPIRKARGIEGVVFFRAIPHFHEDKVTTPKPPFLRGIFCLPLTHINKMKIPIQSSYFSVLVLNIPSTLTALPLSSRKLCHPLQPRVQRKTMGNEVLTGE